MHVLGLDIGTTSTKAVVFDLQGNVVSEYGVEYPLLTPKPSWAEQDTGAILTAAVQAINQAVQKAGSASLLGVGISSAMHSLILMDERNQPMTNTIIWADNRSTEQSHRLRQGKGKEIYLRTGTPIHPMSPLSKILWFKEQVPELFSKAAKFISIKEYLLFQWFGEYVTDYSIASATGLFHLKQLDYDEEVLNLLGITKQQLSTPVPTTHILKGLRKEAAAAMGVRPDLPFIIGGSDGCLANLGIGALEEGEVAVTIGTSGAIRSVVSEPVTDPDMRTFCYALTEKHWVIGGPTNNGGILLRWVRDQFAAGRSYNDLTAEAQLIEPGSEGLICLPYLSGERAPIWNADARGCFVGMALHHRQPHFIRAAMEGVIYSVYHVGKALQHLSGDFRFVRASGGFAQSPLWCQITADVFGTDVTVPTSHQSSSWGAAILVLYALGHIDRIDAFKDTDPSGHRYTPNRENHQTYQTLFQIYEQVYSSLVDPFAKIAAFQRR